MRPVGRDQVGIWAHLQAIPIAAGVQLQCDIVDRELHEAPVDIQCHGPVRAHRVHARDHAVGVDRGRGAEGREADVDAAQLDQRVVVAADLDRDVVSAEGDRIDRQVLETAVVGRQVTLALQVAQVGVQARRRARQTARQVGVDVQRQVVGLLEREAALDEEEAADAQQGVVQRDADEPLFVVEIEAGVGHLQGQLATLVGIRGLEVDERAHAVQIAPFATLVDRDLQALELELEHRPVDVEMGIPVDLHRVQVGDHAVRVRFIRGVHEHHTDIDVVERDAPAIVVQALTLVEQPVVVAVDEVGAEADEDVDIGGGEEGGRSLQVLDTAVVGRHAFDLGQPALERRIVVDLGRGQAGADVDRREVGLLEVQPAADVDVVRDRQRGAVDLHTQHFASRRVGADIDRGARTGGDGVVGERQHLLWLVRRRFDIVPLDRDALRCQREAVDADERHLIGRGRQHRPRGVLVVRAVEQHQAHVQTRELQAQRVVPVAADTRKSPSVGHPDGQGTAGDLDVVRGLEGGVGTGDAEITRHLDEAEDVDDQTAGQLRHVAAAAVYGQCQIARRTRGHDEVGLAGAVCILRVDEAVVDNRVV